MPRKVAVVDDDRGVREALASALEAEGYQVVVVPNGLKLMGVLRIDRPDLILLDVMMSWIDGFELCTALKKNPEFAKVPVVFISARTTRADIERGLACGAVDYVTKPFDLDDLLGRIGRILTGGPTGERQQPAL